jgi:diguanylate cyclase (GGDEF)-like protein
MTVSQFSLLSDQPSAAAAGISEAGRLEAVRIAQLKEIFEFGAMTYVFNALITTSVMLIYYFGTRGEGQAIFFWGLGNLFVLLMRIGLQSYLDRSRDRYSTRFILAGLTASSLVGGLAWAALPLIIPNIQMAGEHTYITVTLVGMTAGSMVRGVPFANIVIAFSLPPISTIAILLLRDASFESVVLGLNAILLTVVLMRASLKGSHAFAANAVTRYEATRMALSLQEANNDIRETNKALEALANGDPMTGLANRAKFNAELRKAMDAASHGGKVALFIMDLDKFKFVNDTLGHAAGDLLLVEVARRLSEVLGGRGLAARLGGDEFAVVLSRVASDEEALAVAEACLKGICSSIVLSGREFVVQASMGVAVFPDHAASPDDLFACADRALYRSKAGGTCTPMIFTSDMRQTAERQSRIELDIRQALHAGEVDAWFQPQVRLCDGKLIGLESLVRWHHPVLGPVSAREIVDAVHARRVHEMLTRLMADKACSMLRRLRNAGHGDISVAINLSAQDFAHYDVPAALSEIVARHEVDPASVELEFTEEALLDPKILGPSLKALEAAGFRLALDDFGMGSTSLNYLMSMRVDRLKIDRSFVTGVGSSRHNQALVTAMVALGGMLDINILVEGVETEEDRAMSARLGCHAAQGYLFAQPMPAARVVEWLANRDKAA